MTSVAKATAAPLLGRELPGEGLAQPLDRHDARRIGKRPDIGSRLEEGLVGDIAEAHFLLNFFPPAAPRYVPK